MSPFLLPPEQQPGTPPHPPSSGHRPPQIATGPASDSLAGPAMVPLLTGSLFKPDRYRFYEILDSTNQEAARLAAGGAPEGTVVVSYQQTRGRGRLGRVWYSPPGDTLPFSMVLRPRLEPRYAAQMTLLTGLAMARTVLQTGVSGLEIKWPNDILLQRRKLAGILTEMRADGHRVRHVVVGIGVNLNGSSAAFPAELRDRVAILAEALPEKCHRGRFLAGFLAVFADWYDRFQTQGFAPIRRAWLEHASVRGTPVRVNLMASCFEGQAVDLDAEGRLLVQRRNGTLERVTAGDVTLLDAGDTGYAAGY